MAIALTTEQKQVAEVKAITAAHEAAVAYEAAALQRRKLQATAIEQKVEERKAAEVKVTTPAEQQIIEYALSQGATYEQAVKAAEAEVKVTAPIVTAPAEKKVAVTYTKGYTPPPPAPVTIPAPTEAELLKIKRELEYPVPKVIDIAPIIEQKAREIAKETGTPYLTVKSSIEKHPEEYGIVTKPTPDAFEAIGVTIFKEADYIRENPKDKAAVKAFKSKYGAIAYKRFVTDKFYMTVYEAVEIKGVQDLVSNIIRLEAIEKYVDLDTFKKDIKTINDEFKLLPEACKNQSNIDKYTNKATEVQNKWSGRTDDEGYFTGTEGEYNEYLAEIGNLSKILSPREVLALGNYANKYDRFETSWKSQQPLIDEYYARSEASSDAFETMGFTQKVAFSALKDPIQFSKDFAISMIPVYGTIKYWDAMPGWAKVVSIAGDVLFIGLVTGQISGGIKMGLGVTRSVGRAIRAATIAPFTPFIHPIASFKALLSPLESIFRAKKLPNSVLWRGTYGPHTISKVGVGVNPLVTRKAMAEVSKLATAGKKATVITPDGTVIKFSPTGLQGIVGEMTIHATSHVPSPGYSFLVAMKGKEPVLYTAPVGYYGRLGEAPVAISKAGAEIGDIVKGGKIASKGITIGEIIDGAKALDLKGKVLGTYSRGRVVDKAGSVIGNVVEGGHVVGPTGKITGFFPEGTKLVGIYGERLGKLTSKPGYMMIATKGVQELPEYVRTAPTMKEMERRFFELVRKGEIDPGLYEVAKQWAGSIELETQYPAGARFVPVLDKAGKPAVYWTRGVGGEKISVPLLQEASAGWFEGGLKTVKELSKMPVETYRGVNFSKVANIPKRANKLLRDWFRANPDATMYGGIVEYTQLPKGRIPLDIDMVFPNPGKAAKELAEIIGESTTASVRVGKAPLGGAIVEIYKDGMWKKVFDIHPDIVKDLSYGLKAGDTILVDGIRVETLSSQLSRKFVESVSDWTDNPLRFKYMADELLKHGPKGAGVGLEQYFGGIGAKPFTSSQLAKLKARGVYNTIRDIFKKELTVSNRSGGVTAIAPDLTPNLENIIRIESELASIGRTLRVATGARAVSIRVSLRAEANKLIKEYNRSCQRLQDELLDRFTGRVEVLPARVEVPRVKAEVAVPRIPSVERPVVAEIKRVPPVKRISPVERVPPVARAPRVPDVARVPDVPRIKVPRVPRIPRVAPPRIVPPKVLPPVPRLLRPEVKDEKRKKGYEHAVAWRQGMLKRHGKLEAIYKVWTPPYRQEDLETFFESELPAGVKITLGGAKSAYKSVQLLKGTQPPSEARQADIGAMLVTIKAPTLAPGRAGAIKFTRDPSDMPAKIKGTPKFAVTTSKLRRKKRALKTDSRKVSEPMVTTTR